MSNCFNDLAIKSSESQGTLGFVFDRVLRLRLGIELRLQSLLSRLPHSLGNEIACLLAFVAAETIGFNTALTLR